MNRYISLSDDYYINLNLSTEMELPSNRETLLHYFDQVSKKYPAMQNFYKRDKTTHVLESEKDSGSYRWCSVEKQRVCSGYVNPNSVEEAIEQHAYVLDLAPYSLSMSPLDCEVMDFLMGFDFTYRGNHNLLLKEALGIGPAFESFVDTPGATVLNHEPSLTLALDEDCRTQCRLSFEPRTNAYQIRTGEYLEDQLSVYLTARQYGGIPKGETYLSVMNKLADICLDMVERHVVEQVLEPLARKIALE